MPARAAARKPDAIPEPLELSAVAERIGVKPHVLRYWETEFPVLRHGVGGAKRRNYGAEDVALLEQIKHLLYTERLTVSGARRRLGALRRSDLAPTGRPVERQAQSALLLAIRRELESLRQLLA